MFRKQLTGVYISESTLGVCRISSAGKPEGRRPPKVRFVDLVEAEEGGSFLDETENSAKELKRLLKKHRIGGGDAALVIPTREVIFRTAALPVMEEADFNDAAAMGGLWDAFSWAPASPDEYSVDFIRHHYTPSSAETMAASLVAVRNDRLATYLAILRQAGLTPVIVDVANLSASRALLRWRPVAGMEKYALEKFVLYESIAEGDHLTLVDGDILELSELYIDHSLKRGLRTVDTPKQDDLHQLISSVASQLRGVIPDNGNRVQEEPGTEVVDESMDNIPNQETSQRSEPLPLFVLSDLPALATSWQDFSDGLTAQGIPLHPLKQLFKRPKVVDKALSQFNNSEAVVALIGLSLRRFELKEGAASSLYGQQDGVNLLPGYRALRKGRKKRSLLKSTTLLLGLPLFLLMLFLHYQQWMETVAVSSQLATYERLGNSISSNKEKLASSTQSLLELQTLLDVAERAGNNYQESYHVLVHVSRSIPLGIRLVEIHTTDGISVTIRGKARKDSQILEMIELMRRDGIFSRVSLRTIQQERSETGPRRRLGKEGREFILHCVVSPTFKADKAAPKASLLFHKDSLAHTIWLESRG